MQLFKAIGIPLITAALLSLFAFTFAVRGDVSTLQEKARSTEKRYVEINAKLDRLIFHIIRGKRQP
jgi:hypothetical protein